MYSVNRRGPTHRDTSLWNPVAACCFFTEGAGYPDLLRSVTKIADEPLKSLVFQSYASKFIDEGLMLHAFERFA